jgi:uncharacterized damage-inducible protein DinB
VKHLLSARLAYVRQDLRESLEGLSDSDLDYAPVAGMRTVRGLLIEIIATELDLISSNLGHQPPMTYKAAEEHVGRCATFEELIQELDQVRGYTLYLLEVADDEWLNGEIPTNPQWMEGMGLQSVPRAEVFRTIAQHEWYHAGQLVSYLWAQGKNPYNGL